MFRPVLRMSVALSIAVWATAILPASAQVTTGTIAGSVRDAQGAVVPGATVTLVSAVRGTTTEAQTNSDGDFVFPNVTAGTYLVRVTLEGFKTLERPGIVVSPGDRVLVQTLTIEVGTLAETVTVQGESPVIQASSGERSFTVPTAAVENLPIANRGFAGLASLAPGVGSGNNPGRIGGGGQNNIMMDGISTMDTGNNGILLQMNVESIAEVKVLTSGYQAEYGRSSGLQITAVTKSGTNQFRGSLYGVFRDSDWNSNSRTNVRNGDPKTALEEKDLGYSIGGPIGRPGRNNKLFFFYSHEYAPRTGGNNIVRYRMPTDLERRGDFSRSYDNNGALFPFIRDPLLSGTCSATSQSACFNDGGVLGKIPAGRLYQTGINLLNLYPLPNIDGAGLAYNYEITRPTEEALAMQPAIRVDYQPFQSLRATVKYSGFRQRNQVFNGTLPRFNDAQQQDPVISTLAMTVNYNLNSSTFLEATYGQSQNAFGGCIFGQANTGPVFCTTGIPRNDVSNRNIAGLGDLPMIFPDALKLDTRYYAYEILQRMQPPFWVNGQLLITPTSVTWGNRIANAPPNMTYPGFLNINATKDVAISVTKVAGRHTLKAGFYNNYSRKSQNQNSAATFGALNFANDTSNPIDAQFGFANAVLGVFTSYNQLSRYIEGKYLYNNTEGYLQDNWKVNSKLTLDYGVRFVHQQPQYDSLGQASNFLPEKWTQSQAPILYVAGCVNNADPCSGANRQARNPQTGQLLGVGSAAAIGTIVPNTGNPLNGLYLSGDGITETTYTYPSLGVAPRFGMAYDLTGEQRMVLRGGGGLFYDRPNGNDIYAQVTNPPAVQNVTVRYAQLQSLSSGLSTVGAPALNVYQYDAKLPSSWQWSGGLQLMLPWSTSLDVAYAGQHSWNTPQAVNINAVDFGAAFLPQNQDPTLPTSATPGATALVTDLMRGYRGYGSITRRMSTLWRTFHGINVSFQRRFTNGVSFGFNDTITLSDRQNSNARLQHAADGTFSYRPDQAEADALFQTDPVVHTMKANFIWDLPDLRSNRSALRGIGLVINDWQLSGIWTASTSAPYQIGFSYQSGGSNVNLTGSPDYAARVRVVGDPGSGCTDDIYRQFNTAAFQGPLVGSVGLESDNNYVKGCFQSVLDLSIARNIRLPKGRLVQLRVEMFNAPNAAIITGRNTTMNLSTPNDPVTITNLPFDANGNPIPARLRPRDAGFGVATTYISPRTVQAQIRFQF
jgi:Carboxypeptidase regulatory-like domain